MAKPLVETKARVGVFSIALQAYLPQFPQLVPEFESSLNLYQSLKLSMQPSRRRCPTPLRLLTEAW